MPIFRIKYTEYTHSAFATFISKLSSTLILFATLALFGSIGAFVSGEPLWGIAMLLITGCLVGLMFGGYLLAEHIARKAFLKLVKSDWRIKSDWHFARKVAADNPQVALEIICLNDEYRLKYYTKFNEFPTPENVKARLQKSDVDTGM